MSTRRDALRGAMAGTLGLLVVGCGEDDAQDPPGPTAQRGVSLSVLADWHEVEAATLAAYEIAASRLRDDAGRREVRELARRERAQLDRLTRSIRGLGGAVPTAAAAASGTGPADAGSRTLLEDCVERERSAIARYVGRIGELEPAALRSEVVPNLAQAGEHLVVLGRLLEQPVAPRATLESIR